MKHLITLLFLIQVGGLLAQDFQYEYIDQSLTSNLRDVYFVNEQVGYVASYLGEVIKSTDGGETWTLTNLDNEEPVLGIQFIDENVGFAVGGKASCSPTPCDRPGSLVFKTTDGGETWTTTRLDDKELYGLEFIDENTVIVVGLGNMYKTVDGGDSWNEIVIDPFVNMQEIKFRNGIGYLSGGSGSMLTSIDEGETWQPLNTGINFYLSTFDWANESVGFAAGQNGFIKTTDGGISWEELPNAPSGIYSVTAFSPDYIVASGRGFPNFGIFKGTLYFSVDGGNTWTTDGPLDLFSITHTQFLSESLGFGVAQGSQILKLTTEDIVNTIEQNDHPTKIHTFPNPTTDLIYYKGATILPGSTIKVLNLKGQVVMNRAISVHELNVSQLENGMYIYQISNSEKTFYGKFIKE